VRGRGGYVCGMWFGELHNCVVDFEGKFDVCVFERLVIFLTCVEECVKVVHFLSCVEAVARCG
jgi:hypothetical protein